MSTPVRRAIFGKLAGDTTLTTLLAAAPSGYSQNIYHDRAPANAGFPFVILSKSSGVPTEAFHDPSALETDVWLVKGVVRDDIVGSSASDAAEAIAARIQTLLNDAALSISGATLLYLRRQSDVEYPELVDGVTYRHAGGLYRLITD